MSHTILRAPGRIVINPTNMAADPPFGGVFAGRAMDVALVESGGPGRSIVSELLGETTEILEPNNATSFACFLRGWNDEAVEQFLANGYAEGDETRRAGYSSPGNRTPGQSALDRAVKLVFVADNPVDGISLLIHRFVPFWDAEAQLRWSRRDEFGIPLRGECLRGANGRIYDLKRLADLTLT